MALDLQYDILNDAPASASPVNSNFTRLEQFINTEVITRDGTVAMAAPLRLYGDPTQNLDAATKSYVDAMMPLGLIMMFGGTAVPGGKWALCNGSEMETAAWSALFAVIGNNFSPAGTPAGRFHLPNLQGRVAVGPSTTDPVITVGSTGGSARLPIHSHQMDHAHSGNTNQEQGWHNHDGIDHLHRVTGGTGGQNQSHYHGPNEGAVDYLMGQLGTGQFLQKGGTAQPYGAQVSTNWASNDHAHGVDIWSGAADRPLTTGNQKSFHTHPFTTDTHSGRTATEGTETPIATANMPPFVCIQYVIRVS